MNRPGSEGQGDGEEGRRAEGEEYLRDFKDIEGCLGFKSRFNDQGKRKTFLRKGKFG